MSTAMVKVDEQSVLAEYTREQVDLIKSQVAPKATDDELRLFLYVAKKRGLDPLARQIYCIHRSVWNSETRLTEPKMTLQTSIDGFRSIAERTGTYAPGDETWTEDENGPTSATVTVRKLVHGTWLTFSATAHFSEYVQTFFDRKAQADKIAGLWVKMPRVMLAKCAEAKALRKGWPEQLGGLYTDEEMQQADVPADRFAALAQDPPKPAPVAVAPEHQPKVIEAPKPKKSIVPPLPDEITVIPKEILEWIAPLRPLTAVPLRAMTIDDLDLVVEQVRAFHPKFKTAEGKAWLKAIEAQATHLRGEMESFAGAIEDYPANGDEAQP